MNGCPTNIKKNSLKAWVEAMRLRTLPASIAGVLAGCGIAANAGKFSWPQAVICFTFALVAQIISNFANEYFDFVNGLDKKGRDGFRRGVTEGDLSPKAMRTATIILLIIAGMLGCSLIYWGGWWLITVGIAIAVFAIAYSAGPYPLSHHGLGDIAVVIFFGIVPVSFTAYLQILDTGAFIESLPIGLAIGLQATNILIVNNYRDMDDDKSVGKRTTVVIFGRRTMSRVYLINGLLALILIVFTVRLKANVLWLLGIPVCEPLLMKLWRELTTRSGSSLNPVLGKTAMLLLIEAVWITLALSLG